MNQNDKKYIAIMECNVEDGHIVLQFPPAAIQLTGNTFYISVSQFGETLNVYTDAEWASVLARLAVLPETRKRSLAPFLKLVAKVEAGKDRRVVISESLADATMINKDMALILYERPVKYQTGLTLDSASLLLSTQRAFEYISSDQTVDDQ